MTGNYSQDSTCLEVVESEYGARYQTRGIVQMARYSMRTLSEIQNQEQLILLGYVHSSPGWHQRHLGCWVDLCALIQQHLCHSTLKPLRVGLSMGRCYKLQFGTTSLPHLIYCGVRLDSTYNDLMSDLSMAMVKLLIQ